VIAVALSALLPAAASADTVSLSQYQRRLQEVRGLLSLGRTAPAAQRAAAATEAITQLLRTTAVQATDGATIAVDDSRLSDGIVNTESAMTDALARLDARIAVVSRAGAPPIDAASADTRLRDILSQSGAAAAPIDLLDAIGRAILRFLSGLSGPAIDLLALWPALGLLGIAVILFVLATLGRALPERVRREVLVRGAASEQRSDPIVHLRAADAALAAGRSREALHALYLYVITALEVRETIRYDPALTDRELLLRAAAIPHADSLRDLVALYERSWFGLREPSGDEARRARALALQVAP
jgi:hypothetical protein